MTVEDRRIRKTKKALEQGLIELLTEKEIHKITIKELTERVDIHRGTFYVHYEDIYSLYRSIEDKVLRDITILLTIEYSTVIEGTTNFYRSLLTYVLDNRDLCRLLFQESENAYVTKALHQLASEFILNHWKELKNTNVDNMRKLFYTQFYLTGFFSIVSKWISDDYSCSIDELIMIIADLDEYFCEFLVRQSGVAE
jgi:AcrR family transcriptional regulator